jgi:alpha-N-arabinofuranosidase
MTERGGPAWRQTIFHPFSQASKFGHGKVLRTAGDHHSAAVLHDETTGRASVFVLNRADETPLSVDFRGLGQRKLTFASELHHGDLKATNSRSAPHTVSPESHPDAVVGGGVLKATLKPLSWNVFVTDAA